MQLNSKKLALTSFLLALSLIIGTIESLLPPIIIAMPYFRLGLSNLVVLFAFLTIGSIPTLIIVIGKSIFVALFLGNPIMILYSLGGGILAYLSTIILLKLKIMRLPAISALSAFAHNVGQLSVAAIFTKTTAVFAYLPFLGTLGILAGIGIGFLTWLIIKYLPKKMLF